MAPLGRRGSVTLIVFIGLLLPALAFLQYRWTSELSDLEQLRARTNLDAAAQRLSVEFDAMLASLYAQVGAMAEAREAGAAPPATKAFPIALDRLAKTLYVVGRDADRFTIREARAPKQEGHSTAWPEWLERPGKRGFTHVLLDEVPAFVAPRAGHANEWIVAVLDRDVIINEVLPAVLAGCLIGGIPVSYDVLITRDDPPDQLIYSSRAGLTTAEFEGWVTLMPLFAVHSRDLDASTASGLLPDAGVHRWRLFIKPPSGALEAAVGAVRARNLAIGAGVLALLALSVGVLLVLTHQVQKSSRRQLEVVARMSHELRTPLAAISCAGDNLADDLVGTPNDAREYGRIIQQEGRRLNKTIADILLCCRLQARTESVLNLRPTDVRGVIDQAVSDGRSVTNLESADVKTSVEPNLPSILADREALRIAIKNLVVNAIRHGRGAPVRVSAFTRRTGHVVIEVDDLGPGIPADELPHVFEPFFRGRSARDAQVEGSGIGLSVVYQVIRSHGGRIRVSRLEPHGTRFTIQFAPHEATAPARGDSAA